MNFPAPSCHLPALIMLAMLIGCAADGEYPSLAPRTAEQVRAETTESGAAPSRSSVTRNPALVARADRLVAAAFVSGNEFNAAVNAAQDAASAAGPSGSESWVVAQQALSRAEAARSPAVNALAELDQLLIAAAGEGAAMADIEELNRAIARIRELVRAQEEQMAAIGNRISGL